MTDLERWIEHGPLSDPGGFLCNLTGLPAGTAAANRIIQGLLIHTEWLAAYGVNENTFGTASRLTLPVSQRLEAILGQDARPLDNPRLPEHRAVATCRDFALFLCSILRSRGIPARVRCGFASYFHDDWEDHWVCEYWDRSAAIWRLSDAQLDDVVAGKCHVAFDPTDVPRQLFVTAGVAWLDCRSGRSDPNRYGHGRTKGWRFLKVNTIRDHYAINNREVSVWDDWRVASASAWDLNDREIALLDALANVPERPFTEISPDWVS